MRLRVIGERYGIKPDRCAQIKEKAIRRIRHPSRYRYLRYGMAEVAKREMEPPKVVSVEEGGDYILRSSDFDEVTILCPR